MIHVESVYEPNTAAIPHPLLVPAAADKTIRAFAQRERWRSRCELLLLIQALRKLYCVQREFAQRYQCEALLALESGENINDQDVKGKWLHPLRIKWAEADLAAFTVSACTQIASDLADAQIERAADNDYYWWLDDNIYE